MPPASFELRSGRSAYRGSQNPDADGRLFDSVNGKVMYDPLPSDRPLVTNVREHCAWESSISFDRDT